MRNCNKCAKDNLCDGCDKLVNQKQEFSANLNEMKREPPNELVTCFLSIYQFEKDQNILFMKCIFN